MLPDMSSVLDEFSQEITLKTIVQTVVNFRPADTPTNTTILAVVQPANKEKITAVLVDFSLDYILVHSKTAIAIGSFVVYKGATYKAIELGQYSDYGFHEVICEETK